MPESPKRSQGRPERQREQISWSARIAGEAQACGVEQEGARV